MELKLFELTNGSVMLTANASAGIYNAAQLKLIASLCDSEVALVKATEDQRLAICVAKEHVDVVTTQLESVGLGVSHFKSGIIQPSACLGELCPKHEQDAMGAAIDVGEQLSTLSVPAQLKIGINGCAECCVPCHTNEISIIGESEGYRISVGGKGSQIPELSTYVAEAVPASELAQRVKAVVTTYAENAEAGETFQEYIERSGIQKIVDVLSPYSSEATSSSSVGIEASSIVPLQQPELPFEPSEFRIEDLSDIEILPADEDQKFDMSPKAIIDDSELEMAHIEVNPVEGDIAHQEIVDSGESEVKEAVLDSEIIDAGEESEPLMIEDHVAELASESLLIANHDFQDSPPNKSKLSLVELANDTEQAEPAQNVAQLDQVTRCEIKGHNQLKIQFESGAQIEFKGIKSREFEFAGKFIKVTNKGSQLSVEVDDVVFSFPIQMAS